uniref:Peptidase S1 domain-containing protein n=1 Tax=Oryza punctata TaxID=4537 RepID=A0A0E0KAM2_ORYPU
MAPPDTFSNALERWVYRNCASSIVCVELRPNPDLLFDWQNDLFPIPEGPEENVQLAQRKADCQLPMHCTGFVIEPVELDPVHIYVLTCAHALGPVFNAEQPIDVELVNDLYQPYIICDHMEQAYLNELQHNNQVVREYIRGFVVAVNCANDLLLIECTTVRFNVHLRCGMPHPPLAIAPQFPKPLRKVVMVSWPHPTRNRTAVTGEISHPGRQFDELYPENPLGFTMMLSEVQIRSEQGSSGGPLLNGQAEVTGLLHGGNGSFSYFVSLHNLREVLTEWGKAQERPTF